MSKEQIEASIRAFWMLWGNHVEGNLHEHAAREAAADLMSESGLLDVPAEVHQMFAQAIEVGYAVALQEVENGDHDDELRSWRPDLFE